MLTIYDGCLVLPAAEVAKVVAALIATDQVPPSKQTTESGVKWPVKLHRRRNEYDMVSHVPARSCNTYRHCSASTVHKVRVLL